MRCITTGVLVYTLFSLLGCSRGENNTSWYPVDRDGDHYSQYDDCDDDEPLAHPGAVERIDGIDNDCDGVIDNGASEPSEDTEDDEPVEDEPVDMPTWYVDIDRDGYGESIPGINRESFDWPGDGWSSNSGDAFPTNPDEH